MAKKSKGSFISHSAYNQTGTDDTTAEQKDPYFSYEDMLANHGAEHDNSMMETVNSESGEIMGHQAPGEPKFGKK